MVPRPPTARSKTPIGGFSPFELVVAKGAFSREADAWRPYLAVGPQQPFDFFCWLAGDADVDEDTERTERIVPKPLELLSFCYSELPQKLRHSLHAALLKAFRQGRRPAVEQEHEHLAQLLLETVTTSEPKPRAGAVHVRATITRIPRTRVLEV